jgi:hypothetical protein
MSYPASRSQQFGYQHNFASSPPMRNDLAFQASANHNAVPNQQSWTPPYLDNTYGQGAQYPVSWSVGESLRSARADQSPRTQEPSQPNQFEPYHGGQVYHHHGQDLQTMVPVSQSQSSNHISCH